MALCRMLNVLTLYRKSKQPLHNVCALISSSKKIKDKISYPPEELFPRKYPPAPKTVEDFENPKNWISYGYNFESYEEDLKEHRVSSFLIISVLTVFVPYMWFYAPDPQGRDWAIREAYLELHRREKLGLPFIDKNYIDPEKMILPTDEEIRDEEVII